MSVTGPTLQIVQLAKDHVDGLLDLLSALEAAGEGPQFRPHPVDRSYIAWLADSPGSDLYYVVMLDRQVVGYGLLRGWNEGYETPSLGIAVHPAYRGLRVGNILMQFLHAAARLRGSGRVRLRVIPSNTKAIGLYERTGYRFEEAVEHDAAGQSLMVAYKDLSA